MALERKDEIGGLWLQCNLVLTVRATLVQDNEDSGNETKHTKQLLVELESFRNHKGYNVTLPKILDTIDVLRKWEFFLFFLFITFLKRQF